jgi:hypothetical protein
VETEETTLEEATLETLSTLYVYCYSLLWASYPKQGTPRHNWNTAKVDVKHQSINMTCYCFTYNLLSKHDIINMALFCLTYNLLPKHDLIHMTYLLSYLKRIAQAWYNPHGMATVFHMTSFLNIACFRLYVLLWTTYPYIA